MEIFVLGAKTKLGRGGVYAHAADGVALGGSGRRWRVVEGGHGRLSWPATLAVAGFDAATLLLDPGGMTLYLAGR